ncbi:DUF5060 domain-containing protein [Stratiformator vulcanicus]|uniref:DUF5060 domain-containing protein n=1 Tax=Stratiformator vulcanicus TaxID=2527980 RepID=A0A517QY95_9PLAN|nr:DUF5060 domain-containing protein [Stratiformator vulcanicus]QDT36564.1 hypothetical protein Pan189_09240 [Stratiformator vulcanicus]
MTLALTVALLATVSAAEVDGEAVQWEETVLTFSGPRCAEGGTPSPFTDVRATVTFSHEESGKLLSVPAYFAADGNAAQSGATEGSKWRAHFRPHLSGRWTYRIDIRVGKGVAISDKQMPGEAFGEGDDGASGKIDIEGAVFTQPVPGPMIAPRYVDERYLKDVATGQYWLKLGAGSPENFLAYADFDGTRSVKGEVRSRKNDHKRTVGFLHRYEPHIKDWNDGDLVWHTSKGKGIIGAINYLSSRGVNSIYMLTMNVIGDGQDVWPWTGPEERDRYDVSKLAQWEIVFDHMDRKGMMINLITQEQENDQLLDGGELGPERKLYYRELIARFAHHRAITWDLGEEITNTEEQTIAFADYFSKLDPYGHLISVHTFPKDQEKRYPPLLGDKSKVTATAIQTSGGKSQVAQSVQRWVKESAAAGKPWVVMVDEPGTAGEGAKPDADAPNRDFDRRYHLWPALMSGGGGIDWYFGYKFPHHDLNLEDFRSRDELWRQSKVAIDFFHENLPFARMESADDLLKTDSKYVHCLAETDEIYCVFAPKGAEFSLKLGHGRYQAHEFDPIKGGPLRPLYKAEVDGNDFTRPPKGAANRDRVVLYQRVRRDG